MTVGQRPLQYIGGFLTGVAVVLLASVIVALGDVPDRSEAGTRASGAVRSR